MNPISLDNFKKEVDRVREYLKYIQYVDDLAGYVVVELFKMSHIKNLKFLKKQILL
ncbi:hypothetical protein [Limnofasciculus baicalensis]|uniref:Uncharacterized protein n=1 Tax=Limnofasciculus baicalensis BBK-W-15 TaxID=2699891 RepID=A0AAE3GQB1_9CYAN|nr:hypothetical protein [Limnofasciculus baicalensis]MCP2728771.1 hypothetical protein [Limnofasciculus baicalensis BBK-W-15]